MCKTNCTRICSPSDFFPNVKGNLTKIVWAHAVNSQAKLEKALSSGDVMMLEADVVMGKLNNTNNTSEIPIMAHPPNTESDLSLEEFLNITNTNGSKGIKLDFKTNDAFNNSKSILKKWQPILKRPVFLNADILSGPVNATLPLVGKEFIKEANDIIPDAILSIGWTTRYGKEFNITKGRYSAEQLKKMVDTVAESRVTQPVTYPVRAGLAVNDIDAMKALLKNTKNATLTIWSAEGDSVDPAKLSKLIKEVDIDKVYVDVPNDLRSKLNLSGASAMTPAVMMTLGASMALLVLSRML
ncbi:PREDICTED: protein FAM151B isoform X2 [Wasmannia auropunctata]|nr:PREDICTED: protein FAM151B isoform X2 [Wasmannia auropunctata]